MLPTGRDADCREDLSVAESIPWPVFPAAVPEGHPVTAARLVLWDVDHTLVELRKLHYDLYATAFEMVFERPADSLPDMSGRTDRYSSTVIMREHGIEPSEDNLQRMWTGLLKALDRTAPDLSRIGHTTPGAGDAVAAVARLPHTYQSVLTGNIRPLAERKVTAFNLQEHLDLDVGGYGDDSVDRADLVASARRRLRDKHGIELSASRVVLIGDTPNDVAAAMGAGTRVIGVSTGPATPHDLRAAGATEVLEDLSNADAVVRSIELVTSHEQSG